MSEEGTTFFIGLILGAFIVFAVNDAATVSTVDVIEGNQFIYKSATYKCEKTNELKEK